MGRNCLLDNGTSGPMCSDDVRSQQLHKRCRTEVGHLARDSGSRRAMC